MIIIQKKKMNYDHDTCSNRSKSFGPLSSIHLRDRLVCLLGDEEIYKWSKIIIKNSCVNDDLLLRT